MWMKLDFLPISSVIQVVLLALGLTYVITGSVIGYRVRFLWCAVFKWQPLSRFQAIVRCPSCNAWWTGAATAFIAGLPLTNVIQLAFTSCGVVALLQAFLGGDGIAADEDMEKILKEVFND